MGSSTQVYAYQRKSRVKFIIGDAKICLGSSVSNYQAREQRFWVDLNAWGQIHIASS